MYMYYVNFLFIWNVYCRVVHEIVMIVEVLVMGDSKSIALNTTVTEFINYIIVLVEAVFVAPRSEELGIAT